MELIRARTFVNGSGVRAVAARDLVTLDEDTSMYPVEALLREWILGNFYVPAELGDSMTAAFQSGGFPFRGAVNMDDVKNVIPPAKAVP